MRYSKNPNDILIILLKEFIQKCFKHNFASEMLTTKLGSMIPLRRQIDKGAIIAIGQVVCFPSKINAISDTQRSSLPSPRVLELSKELDS